MSATIEPPCIFPARVRQHIQVYAVAMVVLGIDPGLANLGLGVVQEETRKSHALFYDCYETSSKRSLPERLGYLYQAVSDTIRIHQPQCVAMEEQFLKKQADIAFKVGQAVGVVQLAVFQAGLEMHTYGPMQVKQALVGTGRADKEQVIYMVKATLGIRELTNNHAADALALALTHLASRKFSALVAR